MDKIIFFTIGFAALITILIDRKIITPKEKLVEKVLNENIKIKNNMTGINFSKKFFKEKDIFIKRIKARGVYNILTNNVKFTPNIKNEMNFVALVTILHEYKHKKDRFYLFFNELIILGNFIHLALVLISHGFFLGYLCVILTTTITMLVKLFAEIRAINYSKNELSKYVENAVFYEKQISKVLFLNKIDKSIMFIFFICTYPFSFYYALSSDSFFVLIETGKDLFSRIINLLG